MPLRPISLSVTSSTQIKILFSDDLSSNISKDNVLISDVGESDSLNISKVEVEGRVLSIYTEPQSDGVYYQISLLSTDEIPFYSSKGIDLINDSSSRKIFFIGSENYNPVRDRMILNAPSNYNLSAGIIRDFISLSADEIYKAQRSAAELLSDNYIRQESKDELRTRTSGPRDRFVNEGAFDIKRVSKFPESYSTLFKSIEYNDFNLNSRHSEISSDPISLQEIIFEEIIDTASLASFSSKRIIGLNNSPVLKVLEVVAVIDGEEYFYDIEMFKYSIKSNKYDTESSYSNSELKDSEISLSDQNNIGNLFESDYLKIKYLYKDSSIRPVGDVEVYSIEEVKSEYVPYQQSSFYLKNLNISNIDGLTPETNGVKFSFLYDDSTPPEFAKEIPYGSKIPSSEGEYSVDYATGHVLLFGRDGSGVSSPGIVSSYFYKRPMKNNFDYYLVDEDIVFNTKRLVLNNQPKIDFDYEIVFKEGTHYKTMSHIEVLNERVGANIGSSFSIKTKNSSINNVFRIKNSTTGEVYQYLYAIGNEVYFSGFRSPEISDFKQNLSAVQTLETIEPSGMTYSKIKDVKVRSVSGNSIYIDPIQSGNIDVSSNRYVFISNISNSTLPIRSIVNSSGLITGFVLNSIDPAPPVNSMAHIGLRKYSFSLKESNILDLSTTKIGTYINSSVVLDNRIFKKERRTNSIERPGEYFIDYKIGKLYFAPDEDLKNYDNIKYYSSRYNLQNRNAFVTSQITRGERYFFNNQIIDDKLTVEDLETEEDFIFEVEDDYKISIDLDFVKVNKIILYNDYLNENITDLNFSISNNIVDLKKSYPIKYREDNSFYYFDIKNESLFFNLRNKNGNIILNENKYLFLENIYFKNIINKKTREDIYLINKSITNKLVKGDVIINNDNKFIITSINKTIGILTVTPEIDGVTLNPNYSIDCFASINIVNNVIKIKKNILNLINETYYVFEKTTSSISPGSKIYVDLDLNYINAEYKYLKDDIYISYEYGDNQIEWIDNTAVLEGENYYVTYEYGAMREKLKDNFGNMTQVPFFTKFPLTVDREFYRDALEGTLASFVKGPTIESIKNITSSIVKTEPEIDEYFYKNWILSRNFLPENKIEYNGDLKFFPVKFKEGLFFGKDNWVKISSESNLSLNEGSISCWIRNDWNGIDNDATITFDIDSVGSNIYSLNLKESIYSSNNNINSIITNDDYGSVVENQNKIYLYNWKQKGSSKDYSSVIVNKSIENFTAGVESTINFRKSVDFSIFNSLYYVNKITHSSFIVNDFTRVFSLDFIIENLSEDYSYVFYVTDRDQELIPNYFKDSNYILCKCNDPDILDDYIGIKNKATLVELSSPIPVDSIRSGFNVSDMVKYCFAVDDNNRVYKIKSVIEDQGNITKIEFYSAPINKGNIYRDSSVLRNSLIGSSFKLFFSYEELSMKQNSYYFSQNNQNFLILTEFDKVYDYQIVLDAKENTLLLYRDKDIFSFNYSDLPRLSDYHSSFESKMGNSNDADLMSSLGGTSFVLYKENEEKIISFESLRIETNALLTSEDIYIGPSGERPKIPNKFSLSKEDIVGMGTVDTRLYEKGLFVGLIENNTGVKDLGEMIWLFKFKAPNAVKIVSDVVNGNLVYEYVKLNYKLDGRITTDGEFSFVSPLSVPIPGYDLVDSASSKYYKFSGFNKIEEDGWNSVYSLEGENDFVGEFYKWIKTGEFDSENSIYSVRNIGGGSSVSTFINDENKDVTLVSDVRVFINEDDILSFEYVSGEASAFLTGISPIKYEGNDISFEVELGIEEDNSGVLFFKTSGNLIDFNKIDWNNGSFNEIKVFISEYVDVYFNGQIINRFSSQELSIDSSIYRNLSITFNRYSFQTNSVIEVASYEYLSSPRYLSSFQEEDRFLYDDSSIEFSLVLNKTIIDGYQDEYSEDNVISDGYIEDDIDEFIFVADKNRYLFEAKGDFENSMSLRKSGKGFLTFEVVDENGEVYSVQSNVKSFRSGEIHHIGASWNLNTEDGDSMHLFIDGDEAPNLVRFGSDIPIDLYDKFSDPEKEVIQNFVVKDIDFDKLRYGSMSAFSDELILEEPIDDTFVGRTIIVEDGGINSSIDSVALIIGEVSEDGITVKLLNIDSLKEYISNTSSTISFKMAPSIGFGDRRVYTNLKHQKFRVFIDDIEVGTSIYDIDENGVFYVDQDVDSTVKTRVFLSKNTIEFVYKNGETWTSGIDKESMVHVKSYGLSIQSINDTINVSSEYSEDGVSLIKTNLPSPIDYKDVRIVKIIEPRFIPDFVIISEN
jgi:hypothetical protein